MSMVRLASREWHERLLELVNDPNSSICVDLSVDDEDEGGHVTKVSVVEVDPEWCHTESWWKDTESDVSDVPTHIMRIITLSNTGWDMPLVLTEDSVAGWHEEDTDIGASGPAYQGCYEYSGGYDLSTGQGIGELVNDPEALQWVDELLEDCMVEPDLDDEDSSRIWV